MVGDSFTLIATVTPEDSDQSIYWYSSDENVAQVVDGNVSCVGIGTADITAKAANSMKAVCHVVVTENSGIENITIDGNSPVKIYNISGNQIFEGKHSDASLDKGIYIVVSKDKRYKLLIK